jgi:catechol 2,3-dioxygenase-like lactoylglutathione lyase family enzyme
VRVVFVDLGNTKFELLEPLGDKSPIRKFLDNNKGGGVHHVCVEVDDINAALEQFKAKNIRALDEKPKIGPILSASASPPPPLACRRARETRCFSPPEGLPRDARRGRAEVRGGGRCTIDFVYTVQKWKKNKKKSLPPPPCSDSTLYKKKTKQRFSVL